MADRPRGREKNVTGHSGPLRRRGQGLNTSPGQRFGGGGGGFGMILMLVAALLFGGGGLSGLFGGGSGTTQQSQSSNSANPILYNVSNTTAGGWTDAQYATPKLNTDVVKGARDKRTKIVGEGKDKVTILVYLCGADLESRSGMATRDLQEMLQARTGDNINLIVYTGGSSRWQNNAVSSYNNQVYQIKDGQLSRLVDNAGNTPMTDPDTLASFIRFGKENFAADRYELILWDHGQGSLGGYGIDERYVNRGTMSLSGLNAALRDGGVSFDFIGFDTCLLATVETANVVTKYADYMIASEETEPGYGWYYTDWLTKFSQNTSAPTIEIGQRIVDDFIETSQRQARGQSATLSVVDLAEFSHTVPKRLNAFAKTLTQKLEDMEYQEVATALNKSRRFAKNSRIDQVDVVNLTDYIDNEAGKELAAAIKSAVKYNRTSSNMANSYGLSIYFPYYTANKVDTMTHIYNDTEMDAEYARAIQGYARLQTSGQASYGGSSAGQQSLFDILGLPSQQSSTSDVDDLLGLFLGGDSDLISGLSGTEFLSNRSLSDDQVKEYVKEHRLDEDKLTWKENGDKYVMELSEKDWKVINRVDLKTLYDDGSGYIDLGLDNIFNINDKDQLEADTQGTWLAVNNQVVAYYHTETIEDGDHYVINGYIPALLNGEEVKLLVQFTDKNPKGSIIGATTVYSDQEVAPVAKNIESINDGDVIDFICDYYGYDGSFQNRYLLGEPITVQGELTISDLILDNATLKLVYQFTDMYNQDHYSQPITIQ
ncbi:MAG: hypothetical protein J6D18_04435 [Erysipelotrichaceae bacterium]|nr:hypothetical protein [Erysipelotrichaceae bacterium]